MKLVIEDQLQKLSDSLVVQLKTSIKADLEKLDDFLKLANERLNSRPQTLDEISVAKKDANEVSQKKQEMLELYKNTLDKNKLLRQTAGHGVVLSNLQQRWQNFEVNIDAFGEMIEEQKKVVRQELNKRLQEGQVQLDKFNSRWTALKPKSFSEMNREDALETADKMKEWHGEWEKLETFIKQLLEDCEHFQVSPPEFKFYNELKEDVQQQQVSWTLFEEFDKALSTLM